jgi:hypothetical protein
MAKLFHPHTAHAWATGLVCIVLLGGCTERPGSNPVSMDPADLPGPQYVVAPGTEPPGPEFVSNPPFDLDVSVQGSFKPNLPLHLSLAAVSNTAAADGELRLTLPEVASAERSGWDVVVMPMNVEFQPHLRLRRAFKAGEKVQERVTITIPEPGYYQLIATGVRHPGASEPHASAMPSAASKELWLWIDEHGGKLTAEYDPTVFAPGIRKQPGPRGSERRHSRLRQGDGDITISCALIPTGTDTSTVVILASPCPGNDSIWVGTPPPPPPSATATFGVSYTEGGTVNALRPLGRARYTWTLMATTGGTIATGNGFTGPDGRIPGTIDCQGTTSDRRIHVQVYTLAEHVNVKRNSQGSELAGSYLGTCGGYSTITANAFMAHLFTNLMKTVDGHYARFGYPPSRINAVLYENDPYTYYDFLKPGGELHIAYVGDMIWNEYGVMVAAHEHGHLWQDRKLWQSPEQNGLLRYWSRDCQRQHPPESASSFACAVGEGFADWYAVVVRETDLPTWRSQLETNYYYRNCVPGYSPGRGNVVCTDDGSIVQGAVGALFWDIIDSSGESHDYIYRTPAMLAEAIRSCRVYQPGSGYIAYNGVDHLIYCIEPRLFT